MSPNPTIQKKRGMLDNLLTALTVAKDFYFKPEAGAAPMIAQPRQIPLPSTTQYPVEQQNIPQEQYQPTMIDRIVTGGDPKKRAYDVRQRRLDEAFKGY